MAVPETQLSNHSKFFVWLEAGIDRIASQDYHLVHEIGLSEGLLVIGDRLLKAGYQDLATKYFWRVFLDGVEFYELHMGNMENGLVLSENETEIVRRNMGIFVATGNYLARILYKSGITPEDSKKWSGLEFILKHGFEICKTFSLPEKNRVSNNLTIFNRSNALHIGETDPEKAAEILDLQTINIKGLIQDEDGADESNPDSRILLVDRYNNLGVLYTDIANLVVQAELTGQENKSRADFGISIENAEIALKEALRILGECKFTDYERYRMKKGMVMSNFSFIYILKSYHTLCSDSFRVSDVTKNIKGFRSNFFGAGNVFQMVPENGELKDFDAELYRTTADILIILLYMRSLAEDFIDQDYLVEENKIIGRFLQDEDKLAYVFNRKGWLTETIKKYIDNGKDLTCEHDDKIRLIQTDRSYKTIKKFNLQPEVDASQDPVSAIL